MPQRHFVKYTFLKVDPAWRRLDAAERARHKREFIAACEDYAQERLLRSFSLVGTRGDADLMLLTQATTLDRIHEFHVLLQQSGLMGWADIPYSFLAMTKPSEYSDESRLEVRPGRGRYLFVYPFVKTRAASSTSCSACAPPRPRPTPSATHRRSPASRCRSSAPSTRSTARPCPS